MAFGNSSGGQHVKHVPQRVNEIPPAPRPFLTPQQRLADMERQFAEARREIKAGFSEIHRMIEEEFTLREHEIPPIQATDFFDYDEEDETVENEWEEKPPQLTMGQKLFARAVLLGGAIFVFIIMGKMIAWAWSIDL